MLASALFLAAGAAGAAPVAAADDMSLVQLHSPCHQALVREMRAASILKNPGVTADDAKRALSAVNDALDWNQKACGTIAGRSPQENAVRRQMHDVNDAFLHSLRAQADTVLHSRFEASDYALANRELAACATSAALPARVVQDCRTQIADNRATQGTSTRQASDPCQAALVAANDAGAALRPKDYTNLEKAYSRATDGLAANGTCGDRQMREVNRAYLLTWKAVADRYLDVPFAADRDIANAADPFQAPNDFFSKCGSSMPPLPPQAKSDCATQLATNQRFWQDYTAQAPTLFTGQTVQPLNWRQIDWPFPLRSDFVWDAPCKNNENARCADEAVRDGSGPNGWGPVAERQAAPLDGDRERVLFATIRNCDDLHRLFSGQPSDVTCDFFKSNIVLVAAQHKPHQQCTMTIDRVASIAAPASTNPPRDAVRLVYTLSCAPPVLGSPGSTATKVLSIPSGNANGTFANVTFVQSGGGGPRSATP